MSKTKPSPNLLLVGQSGRLEAEVVLFMASLRHADPTFDGEVFVAEPQPGSLWSMDPRMSDQGRAALERLCATVVPLENEHFGQSYPYGNKIEALHLLPKNQPFIFFDSDTLITSKISEIEIDFEKPAASEKVTGTWPKPTLYGASTGEIWKSLYDRFDLNFDSTLDLSQPEGFWKRYMYFNAGWFLSSCPHEFGDRFVRFATSIQSNRPDELIGQSLNPWLDQIALPLVIHSLGGGRRSEVSHSLDGDCSCHYRTLPLLFARESQAVIDQLLDVSKPNWIKKVLKEHTPFKRFIYQGKGEKVRALFDQANLPASEQAMRQRIKKAGLWSR